MHRYSSRSARNSLLGRFLLDWNSMTLFRNNLGLGIYRWMTLQRRNLLLWGRGVWLWNNCLRLNRWTVLREICLGLWYSWSGFDLYSFLRCILSYVLDDILSWYRVCCFRMNWIRSTLRWSRLLLRCDGRLLVSNWLRSLVCGWSRNMFGWFDNWDWINSTICCLKIRLLVLLCMYINR